MNRWALRAAVLALVLPGVAWAEPGAACEVSAECGGLHCIEGQCELLLHGRIWRSPQPRHQKPALVYAGSGALVSGLALIVAAMVFSVNTLEPCSGLGCPLHPDDVLAVSIPLGVVGIGGIVAGIVMISDGSHGPPAQLALGPGGIRITW